MNNFIITSILAILAAVFVLLWLNTLRIAKELAEKTSRSLEKEPAFPITLDHRGSIQQIATNYNQLVIKNQQYAQSSVQLKQIQIENEIIENKFKQSEKSTMGIKLFADMGRQITQSLSIDEIAEKLFHLINSASSINQIEIMVTDNKIIYSRNAHTGLHSPLVEIDENSIQNWVLKQHRTAVLGNNQRDHARYIPAPITLENGMVPVSAICVELNIGEKCIGTLTICSGQENVFDPDTVEYIHGLASYTAIAIYNALLYTDLGKQKELVEIEKTKADRLLLNILPKETAEELKETGKAKAMRHDNVTVLFSDFKSFTKIAEAMSPEELVAELDDCFSAFDEISVKYGLEKIKTIGDAYLAVCGLPQARHDHAESMVRAGLEIQEYLKQKNKLREQNGKSPFFARVGIHSGPVVAGVVGKSKFAYDIWGDTVNTAARMEQSGEIDKVNLSGDTWNLVKDLFKGTYRGKIEAKNKGTLDMYFAELL